MDRGNLNVLVVDDSPVIQKVAIKVLADCGVTRVDTALDGLQLFEKIEVKRYDVILLDLNMPNMDGVEVLATADPAKGFPPVILCSASDQKVLKSAREVASLKGVQIVGILEKPYSGQALAALLDKLGTDDRTRKAKVQDILDINHILANLDQSLELVYQPKFCLKKGNVCGVETLARWRNPDGLVLPPATFVPALEDANQTAVLTKLVTARAAAQAAQWARDGIDLSVSVNVSADDLVMPGFIEFVTEVTNKEKLDPQKLTFEVTETKVATDISGMLTTLTRLRLKGFGLSIDDFGCGTSTLQQLRQAPFSELKIDQQFVSHLASDTQNHAIVNSCIDLGHKLGMTIVAEGLETQEDMLELRKLGCESVQGYLIAKPQTADDFIDWYVNSVVTQTNAVTGTESGT
ncbi:MAG: EAL domain-containing response regulator [Rhodobacteraceae bacterium]|nr:EAL domain-containing response regulator [Paracoccaceae bacterium]